MRPQENREGLENEFRDHKMLGGEAQAVSGPREGQLLGKSGERGLSVAVLMFRAQEFQY